MAQALFGFVILICGLVSCKVDSSSKQRTAPLLNWTDTVLLRSENPTIRISNESLETVRFNLKLNGRFPLTTDEMVREIHQLAEMDSTTPAISAWKYVSRNTYSLAPFSPLPWTHDPYIQINSLAGGFCDDRAATLAHLWKKMGYKSRVIGLNGHVVCEVKEDDSWKLFDPTTGVYYVDKKGNIADVEELETNGCAEFQVVANNSFGELMSNCQKFDAPFLIDLYKSANDNEDISDFQLAFEPLSNLTFQLPAGATLIFAQKSQQHGAIAVVELKKGTTGTLRIPLVAYAIGGNGTLQIGDNTYTPTFDSIIRPEKNELQDSIFIHQIDKKTYIYYYLNSQISELKKNNTVSIFNSNGKLKVNSGSSVKRVIDAQREEALKLFASVDRHTGFIKNLPPAISIKTRAEIRKLYIRFLQSESDLSSGQRNVMLDNFPAELKKIQDTLGLDSSQFFNFANNQYPSSLFWMFMTIRYDGYQNLHGSITSDSQIPFVLKE